MHNIYPNYRRSYIQECLLFFHFNVSAAFTYLKEYPDPLASTTENGPFKKQNLRYTAEKLENCRRKLYFKEDDEQRITNKIGVIIKRDPFNSTYTCELLRN